MLHIQSSPHQSVGVLRAEQCIKDVTERGSISFLVTDFDKVSDRPFLFDVHRKLLIANDHLGIQITRNLILQNFLRHKQYVLADKFLSAVLPTESAPGVTTDPHRIHCENEVACFFLHAALVKTVLVDYSTAKKFIALSMRKNLGDSSPQFQLFTRKLSIIIDLFNGGLLEITEDANHPEMRPYIELANCLRRGEISAYEAVVENFKDIFQADGTRLLIQRFRHDVLRMTLRSICRSYSRISMADVAQHLQLDKQPVSNVYYLLMKAIREKVIAAKIDFSRHELICAEFESVYNTPKPFMELHNQIKANKLFQNQLSQMCSAKPNPEAIDEEEEEAMKKKIDDANQELVKAIEDGVDSDAEWMD